MSSFLTTLKAQKVGKSSRGRTLWELLEPLAYQSDLFKGIITAPGGFRTDFASVPRWPLAFLIDGDSAHEAAVIHDYLYCQQITSRKMADDIFREAMMASKESSGRAFRMWLAVRAGGWVAWDNYCEF